MSLPKNKSWKAHKKFTISCVLECCEGYMRGGFGGDGEELMEKSLRRMFRFSKQSMTSVFDGMLLDFCSAYSITSLLPLLFFCRITSTTLLVTATLNLLTP